LDKVQKRVIAGDVKWRGRNKMKNAKQSFDRYQHMNGELISYFCKNKMFPHFKFLQPAYVIFSPENQKSLCYKINQIIDKPSSITSDIDAEFYWVHHTVPMINKKYCKIRSNFNTDVKKMYLGEL
jgi:hypothetical protein